MTVTDEVVALHPEVDDVNVNVAEPTETPVIRPALLTEAIAELLLAHVPPVVGDNIAVLPTHNVNGAFTIGNGVTFTVPVAVITPQPPVNVTV